MAQKRVPGENGPSVDVSAPLPADATPPDVCKSVVETNNDARRYIAYCEGPDGVRNEWLSVDLGVVVARELWR
ncbi:MAG: hypothetical protein ABEJ85_02070 [Haloarculaceae archaeon]